MTKKSTVTVKTKDVKGTKIITAGRHVGVGGQPVTREDNGIEETQVSVELGEVTDTEVMTSGVDAILAATADADLNTAVKALGDILEQTLENQEEIADLRDMITELQAAGKQPPEERNVTKLRRIIKSIGEYVGLATLTVTQLQGMEALIGQIRGWLGL